VHEPSQSALHFVVQLAVVETGVHWVVHVSLQQDWQEAWQSVEEVAVDPSGPDDEEDDEVQDALHPDSQRDEQSVEQSNAGGLFAQVVEQLDWQLDVQSTEAEALHCELHCCSSLAAQASSQLGGAQTVEQLLCDTMLQFALASMSMSPQAEMPARATVGTPSRPAATTAVIVQWARERRWIFMNS
jgi:hypothetical protein